MIYHFKCIWHLDSSRTHTHTHTHTHIHTHTQIEKNQTLYDSYFTWRQDSTSFPSSSSILAPATISREFKDLDNRNFARSDGRSWQCRYVPTASACAAGSGVVVRVVVQWSDGTASRGLCVSASLFLSLCLCLSPGGATPRGGASPQD